MRNDHQPALQRLLRPFDSDALAMGQRNGPRECGHRRMCSSMNNGHYLGLIGAKAHKRGTATCCPPREIC